MAEKSIPDVAARLHGTEKTTDIGVSVDGTWQRKKFLANTWSSDSYF